ncbi:hypothetical protein [Aequorivita capsosiphonis]|uniref:hypothetical protein n=1 Tax=Aequorivita capsosiphonis TaxID=487317 RepID=UPI00042A89B0|nr:hypothetical protein [Aequorivita capsosiphonis]
MKNIILFGLFVFVSLTAIAQSYNSEFDVYSRTIDINQKSLAFGLTEAQFDAIKDEAYANPDFVNGNIYQEDQLLKKEVPMRYNAYADEIEIKKNASDNNYGALTKAPNIFVKMGKDLYVFVPYNGSNAKGGYFNVLNDGKTYDLYKKVTSIFNEPKTAETSYGKDTPPGFTKNVVYYLVEDGTFLEMPNRKSKILKMMDQKKSEMKTFIKENDLDLDNEADLIKAVKHFDSLL